MTKVLIADKMSARAESIFKKRGIEVNVIVGMSPKEIKTCIGEYDGLAVRSSTQVSSDIIQAASNLKVIGRAGIGIDNIDISMATTKPHLVDRTYR